MLLLQPGLHDKAQRRNVGGKPQLYVKACVRNRVLLNCLDPYKSECRVKCRGVKCRGALSKIKNNNIWKYLFI